MGDNPDMIPVGMVLQARLGSRPAYGRVVTATATASYHAVRHANSGGRIWGVTQGYPNWCGDGDGDGWDVNCQARQQPAAQSAPQYRGYAPSGGTYSGSSSFEQCVIARESGGNAQVMNSSGHYGLYQFSSGTWQAYGGSAADFGHASVAEQRRVFDTAIAQGGQSNWSPYDGC